MLVLSFVKNGRPTIDASIIILIDWYLNLLYLFDYMVVVDGLAHQH